MLLPIVHCPLSSSAKYYNSRHRCQRRCRLDRRSAAQHPRCGRRSQRPQSGGMQFDTGCWRICSSCRIMLNISFTSSFTWCWPVAVDTQLTLQCSSCSSPSFEASNTLPLIIVADRLCDFIPIALISQSRTIQNICTNVIYRTFSILVYLGMVNKKLITR